MARAERKSGPSVAVETETPPVEYRRGLRELFVGSPSRSEAKSIPGRDWCVSTRRECDVCHEKRVVAIWRKKIGDHLRDYRLCGPCTIGLILSIEKDDQKPYPPPPSYKEVEKCLTAAT